MRSKLDRVLEILPDLGPSELRAVLVRVQDYLRGFVAIGADDDDDRRGDSKRSAGDGSWLEIRMVNGCGPYVYRRWREDGRKRSRYLGKAVVYGANAQNVEGRPVNREGDTGVRRGLGLADGWDWERSEAEGEDA